MNTEVHDGGVPTALVVPLAQILVGIVLFIALLKGQRDVTLLCLFAFATVFGAKLWSKRSLSRLTCTLSLDKRRVFPGDQVGLELKAENAKFLPVWLQVSLSADESLCPAHAEPPLTRDSSLLWFQQVRFHWDFLAQRRGVYQLGTSGIRVGDPFGLFPRSKDSSDKLQLFVYPRLVPLKPFALPRRDFFGIPGAESPIQDPVYMLGTRDYQHNQPAKHIHWKASARHNHLQEKVFEPTSLEKVLLLLDVEGFSKNAAEEQFELMLEVAASLAARLDRQGYAVGFMTNGRLQAGGSPILPVSRNPQQLAAILEVLAKIQPKARENLFEILRHRPMLGAGISCLYLSYQESATAFKVGEYLRNRKVPVQFVVAQAVAHSTNAHTFRGKMYALDDIAVR